jgi:hypothetical protein
LQSRTLADLVADLPPAFVAAVVAAATRRAG